MKKNKQYDLNQSPLYKINSVKRLVKVLGVSSEETLERLASKSHNNYYFNTLESGREIEVPLSQLRRVHSKVNDLLSRIKTPNYLSSGVKGRSNVSNAKAHLGNTSLLKLDIAKFYPSVTSEQITKCFRKVFGCSKKVSLILSQLTTVNGHIPTGSPISQSLSFYVNRPIFNHINEYSKSRNIKFTCYVDDLTFSGEVIPKSFSNYVTNYLKKNRDYNCHKIRMHNKDSCKSITGAIIKGDQLLVKNVHREKIHNLLKRYNYMIGNHSKDDLALESYFQRLIGHLFSAGQINPAYRSKGKEIVLTRKNLGIKALNQKRK